jgi:hypothetical protein
MWVVATSRIQQLYKLLIKSVLTQIKQTLSKLVIRSLFTVLITTLAIILKLKKQIGPCGVIKYATFKYLAKQLRIQRHVTLNV